MEKSQVSFEFIVLFGLAFFAFVIFLGVLSGGYDMGAGEMDEAARLAKEIKIKAITASLSDADISVKIALPQKIIDSPVRIVIDPSDYLLMVMKKDSNEILAKTFLPRIDSLAIDDPYGDELTISKSGEIITLRLA